MKRLKFKNIWLYSEIEQGAAEFSFSDSFTIIRGANSVGKSRIIKNIFTAFGAETKNPDIWKATKTYTLVEFSIDEEKFFVLENGQKFSLFSQSKQLIKSFLNVKDFSNFLNDLLGISVRLLDINEKDKQPLYAGHLFMPFYLDQDTGWQNNWSSFLRINFLKEWRHSIIDFFVGIKDEKLFELDEKIAHVEKDISALATKLATYKDVLKKIEEKSNMIHFTIDIEEFKDDIESLMRNSTSLYQKQEKIRSTLLSLKNEFITIDLSIELARQTKKMLTHQFHSLLDVDVFKFPCPVCGTQHTNSFINRLKLANEEESYNTHISDLLLKRDSVQKKIAGNTKLIDDISDQITEINSILETKKKEFTLNDFIQSEGAKNYKQTIQNEIKKLCGELSIKYNEEKLLRNARKDCNKNNDRTTIFKKYAEIMKQYSLELDAMDDGDIMENIYGRIKQNGSDGIRSLLAYFFTILYLINENPRAIFCPIVIDTPNQQDQDRVSLNKILNLIKKRTPKGSQIIIGLTNTEEMNLEGVKIIQLEGPKRHILKQENYENVKNKIEPFIEKHLESLWQEIEKRDQRI